MLERRGQRLAAQSQLLGSLGYRQVLGRGFALVRDSKWPAVASRNRCNRWRKARSRICRRAPDRDGGRYAGKGGARQIHARAPEDSAGFAVLTLLALFADIHGNREALDACLADAQRRGAERLIFLGGYDRLWRRSSLCRRSRRRTATRWRHGCPRQSRRRADRRLRQYEQRRGRIDRMDAPAARQKPAGFPSPGCPSPPSAATLLFVHAEAAQTAVLDVCDNFRGGASLIAPPLRSA